MLIYHSILYKNNKLKFIEIILSELLITYLYLLSITSFYKEDIMVLKKDKIHVFVTNQQADIRIFKNKIF